MKNKDLNSTYIYGLECQFARLLERSAVRGEIGDVRRVHAAIAGNEEVRNSRYLANLLVDLYGRQGFVQDARLVFDTIRCPNVYSWNLLLAALGRNGHFDEALGVFREMPCRDLVSWNTILAAQATSGMLQECSSLFNGMTQHSVVSWTTLMQAYAQKGHLQGVRELFMIMPERNVVTWTVMIEAAAAAAAQEDDLIEARNTFELMPQRNVVAWTVMCSGYAQRGMLEEAKNMLPPQGRDVGSWTALLQAYCLQGMSDQATAMFQRMPCTNLWTWNMMIAASAENVDRAWEVFAAQPQRDLVSWNALLRATGSSSRTATEGSCSNIEIVQQVHSKMPGWDIVSWNTLLQACVNLSCDDHQNQAETTIDLFLRSPEKDMVSWNLMIHGSGEATLVELMPAQDIATQTVLIWLHARRGELDQANRIFEAIRAAPPVICWSGLIQGYAVTGAATIATELLWRMNNEGAKPNQLIFAALLLGYSHAGMPEQGRQCFMAMAENYGLSATVEHYCCVVDILGRSERLSEAEELIATMPFLPDVAAWTSLLAACRLHGDIPRGRLAAQQIVGLDARDASTYVLLANTYYSR